MNASAVPGLQRRSTASWVLVAGGFHRNGGMDRCNRALARFLVERGDRVHLVCHDADHEFLKQERVSVHQVGKPGGSFMLGGLLLSREGRKVAHRVSLQSPGTRVLVNGGNCEWPDINWVHCLHHAWEAGPGSSPSWFKLKNSFSRWMFSRQERSCLSQARLVIANSERTRRDLINHLGTDPLRIHTVYPGADPDFAPPTPSRRAAARDWLRIDERKPLVAFVGALGYDDNKGFAALLSAWRRLCARPDWDADLVVAGDGRARELWGRRIVEARLEERIRMLGFTDRIPDLLAAADLLVSPVRYEAYGLNVQEAICCGVPAMVTEAAGIAERYPEELRELLIHDPDDAEELTAGLAAWRATIPQWKERVAPFSRALRAQTLELMAREIVAIAEAAPQPVCKTPLNINPEIGLPQSNPGNHLRF